MTYKERQKAKKIDPKFHLYEGDCIRCGVHTRTLSKENDLCFGCEQDNLEYEEKKNAPPYNINDKEAHFRHEKSIQGWSNDMDEEIWDKHFRYT
jgi:hypothetical protein